MISRSVFLDLDRQFGLAEIVSSLNTPQRATLAAGMKEIQLAASECLFHQHDPCDAMYFLTSGQLRREVLNDGGAPVKTATIDQGKPVGEVEAMSGSPRLCSVYATLPSRLVKLPQEVFDAVIDSNAGAARSMTMFIRRHLRHGLLRECLSVVFPMLDRAMEKDITAAVDWVDLEGGQTLYRQADASDALYVVLSGCLRETALPLTGPTEDLGQVTRGESVGLAEMITDTPRMSTVYAVRDCELARIDKVSFDRLTDKYPSILRRSARRIALLLMQQTGRRPRSHDDKVTIALVPTDADVPVAQFAERLTRMLATEGPALAITSAWVDRRLGTRGISQTQAGAGDGITVSTWLSNLDEFHRFMVYVADAEPTEWSRRCVRQAEQVLTVGNAGADPALSRGERTLLTQRTDISVATRALVLLHPNGNTAPSGTQRWLDARDVGLHHHVRMDREGDLARVARFIAGTAAGLVLGGGGARGFAHVGALRAMREHGIPIDIIGGTSMGAYIGAEYVLGWSEREMLDRSRRIFDIGVYDLTLPMASLVAGKRLAKRLASLFGDVEIPDLWLPYFCVSSNISRGEVMVHRTGLLWKAMRASGGLQGVLPACVHNGDLLVDGALLSNVPADAMKQVNPSGWVIAVDVSPPDDFLENEDYGSSISGWKVLWNKIAPWKTTMQMPSLGAVMQRAAETASNVRQRNTIKTMTDLYVKMPVEQYGLLAFNRADEIRQAGYAHAKTVFDGWDERQRRVIERR